MAKKSSTVENRVYLFKDLASSFLTSQGALLASKDPASRQRALRALGDIAHAACVLSDTATLDANGVGALVARGPETPAVKTQTDKPGGKQTQKKAKGKRSSKRTEKATSKARVSARAAAQNGTEGTSPDTDA